MFQKDLEIDGESDLETELTSYFRLLDQVLLQTHDEDLSDSSSTNEVNDLLHHLDHSSDGINPNPDENSENENIKGDNDNNGAFL